MTKHDRLMWKGRALALREELARIPRHRFNVVKGSDYEAELAQIEAYLGRESAIHAVFLDRRHKSLRQGLPGPSLKAISFGSFQALLRLVATSLPLPHDGPLTIADVNEDFTVGR
jgi:hypothetical protein